MSSNQNSAFTGPYNGADALLNFEESINASVSIPFLDSIRISEFASLDWTTDSFYGDSSKNTYTSTAGAKGKISITSTSSYTENSTASTQNFDFQSGFGDRLKFNNVINSSEVGSTFNSQENVFVDYFYLGDSGTQDDISLKLTFNDKTSGVSSTERQTYNTSGPFSMVFSNAELSFDIAGSYTGNQIYKSGDSYMFNGSLEKDQETHTITKFVLTDKTSDFSLSFSGTLSQDYLANTETANLKKITVNLNGVRIDTASLNYTFNGVGFFLDTDGEITNSEEIYIGNHLLPAVLKENNVMTGNSADNIIYGSQGNDRINGGAGNDTLDLSRFDWSLNDRDAATYTVSGNEKSFTITHRDNGKTHTMAVSNVEFVAIGGETYSVQKFLNPNATEVTGGYFLEQLIEGQNGGELPDALLAIDLNQFAFDDWSSSVFNPDAAKSNLKFKTTDGNTLSYAQTQSAGKDSTILDFASINGDRLNFRRSEEESLSSTRNSYKETDQVNFKYVGDKSTASDDLSIVFSRSDNYTSTQLSGGITNTVGTYSVSLNYSDAYYKLNGAFTNKYNANSDQTGQFITTFNRYSFEDLSTGFKISFTGNETVNPFTDIGTLNLKKLNVSTPDIIINTASVVINGELPDGILGLSNGESLDMIEESLNEVLSDFVLASSNIITIKNNDGYTVFAGDGNDRVTGGIGDDAISGGKGRDTLSGGQGADIFIISGENLTNADVDVITDFNIAQGDKIYIDTSSTGIAFDESTFALTPGLKDIPNDAEIFYDQQRGNLYYDADASGSGAAILIATFSNKAALTADSFMGDIS
jgi:RTX calcium-binding nonapeptide repeat (4 copies)